MLRIHSLSTFFLFKQKKPKTNQTKKTHHKQFFSQSLRSLFETQATPKLKCFIFQMQLFTSVKILQDKKAATKTTTNMECFGSVFAKNILVTYSHFFQFLFIQLVSRGNHSEEPNNSVKLPFSFKSYI